MENCTIVSGGNNTVCYVEVVVDDGRYTLRQVLYMMIATFLLTCLAVALYNQHICVQLRRSQHEKEKEDAASSEDDTRHLSRMTCGSATLPPSLHNSLVSSLAHIEGMEASGNFLSGILAQMWQHAGIAVSNCIKDTLEPTLKEMKPVALHFVRLDLGDVPIRTKNMFIHRVDLERSFKRVGGRERRAGIQIDVDVEWDGNCDVMLQATLTKSVKCTFGVKSIKLSGRMHILLSPLTTELPVISAVQYGFTNPPSVQLEFTGIVQRLTSKFSGLRSAFVSVINSTLASMLVLPQRMVMPMDLGSYDYLDVYQPPLGIVRVTAVEGRGFKVLQKKILKDIPDVYCLIELGASGDFAGRKFRTTTKHDNLSPSWGDESYDFILYDMDQKVYLEVMDEDIAPIDADDELGKAEISVRDLFKDNRGGAADLELELEGKKTQCHVALSAEMFYMSEWLDSFSSPAYSGKNQLCGLVTIIVTKAFNVPVRREDAATYVKVTYGEGTKHEKIFYTGTVSDYPGIDALNPTFDCVFQVPLSAAMLKSPDDGGWGQFASREPAGPPFRRRSFPDPSARRNGGASRRPLLGHSDRGAKPGPDDIVFALVDTEGTQRAKSYGELGTTRVTREELLGARRHAITETRLIGEEGARLEFRVILSGIQSEEEKMREISSPQSSDDLSSSLAPTSLYGGARERQAIRVTAVRGRGFRIKKRYLGERDDVPDVYCSIRLGSSRNRGRWKTSTIKDDTMPQWNESRDFGDVDVARETIFVEAWDENCKGKDERLGTAEFSVENLLRKRLLEAELHEGPVLTKTYVALRCVPIGKTKDARAYSYGMNAVADDDDLLVHHRPQTNNRGYEATLRCENNTVSAGEAEDDGVMGPLPTMSDRTPCLNRTISNSDFILENATKSVNCTSSYVSSCSKRLRIRSPNIMKKMTTRIPPKKKGGLAITKRRTQLET